jgi:regulator of replication initiation timing
MSDDKEIKDDKKDPIIGDTIPPDVEDTKADEAQDARKANNEFFAASMGVYSKLFEQAQTHFTKIADIAQEVMESMVAQGKKVEENMKERMENAHAGEKAKEFAKKAEDQAKEFAKKAEDQAKHFKEQYFNDEKVAEYKKAFEPLNIFAMSKQIDALEEKVVSLEAQIAKLKGEAPANTASNEANVEEAKPKKRAKKEKPSEDETQA